MRRIGVTAATVVLVLAFGTLAVRAANGPSGPIPHSCTAKDQSFIQTATLDVTGLAALADEFKSGAAQPGEVVGQAFDAVERVKHVKPDDPSLRAAQKYLGGMFSEYGIAVVTIGKGKDGSARMQRAYRLANGARDVLAKAQPALQKKGCDVGPLL